MKEMKCNALSLNYGHFLHRYSFRPGPRKGTDRSKPCFKGRYSVAYILICPLSRKESDSSFPERERFPEDLPITATQRECKLRIKLFTAYSIPAPKQLFPVPHRVSTRFLGFFSQLGDTSRLKQMGKALPLSSVPSKIQAGPESLLYHV